MSCLKGRKLRRYVTSRMARFPSFSRYPASSKTSKLSRDETANARISPLESHLSWKRSKRNISVVVLTMVWRNHSTSRARLTTISCNRCKTLLKRRNKNSLRRESRSRRRKKDLRILHMAASRDILKRASSHRRWMRSKRGILTTMTSSSKSFPGEGSSSFLRIEYLRDCEAKAYQHFFWSSYLLIY